MLLTGSKIRQELNQYKRRASMAATVRNPILGHLNEGVNKHNGEIRPIIARALWGKCLC